MFLKKLELIGFKSFADPIAVVFQPGITAIVGPNGCGKSNIVDAILWVLGEQSAKTLRSDRMEDVIFNGSEARKPIGMAEVALTVGGVTPEQLGNQFGEFEELSISRRLFRSGESEYIINKIPCRLKDIRDVLIDTGAGHKGHTIIEQGKVDQLLNASPLDRRALIEETAGIVKYKIRKAEAERKLEATHQNLLRVRDIIAEVKRQIQGLDRQVKKTEAYNALLVELRRLELLLLTEDYRGLDSEFRSVSKLVMESRTEESELLSRLSSLDAEAQNAKSGAVDEEREQSALRQAVFDLQTGIQRHQSRIELLAGQAAAWEEQRVEAGRDQERLDEARAKNAAKTESARNQQEELQASLKRLDEKRAELDRTSREAAERIAGLETALENEKSGLFERIGLLTEAKNRLSAEESRSQEIQRMQEKGRIEFDSVVESHRRKKELLDGEKSRLAGLEKKVGELQGRKAHLTRSIQEKREIEDQARARMDLLRESLTRTTALLDSLKEREKSLMRSETGLREHLKNRPELSSRFHGALLDILEVPREYERAIESVLGDRLQALVGEDHAAIQSAIEHLKEAGQSRGVFLPKTLRTRPGVPGFAARDGVIGPALAFVKARPGFETLLHGLLGGVILVRDLATALSIWRLQPLAETLVTVEGEAVYPSGMITGSLPAEDSEGLLQTRRKLNVLEEEARRFTLELAKAGETQTRLRSELEGLIGEINQILEAERHGEIEASAEKEKTAALEAEVARLSEHRSVLQMEEMNRSQELRALSASVEAARGRIAALEEEKRLIEIKMAELQEGHRQSMDRREALSGELTQLKVETAGSSERLELLKNENARLTLELSTLAERRNQRETEAAGLEERIRAAERDSVEAQSAIRALGEKLSETQSVLGEKNRLYAERLERIKRLEEELGRLRGEWNRVERSMKELELRQTELKTKLSHLREQIGQSHAVSPEEALSARGEEPIDRGGSEARRSELRQKIELMGPVNLAAPEEYKELQDRYQFLTTQEADLSRSIEDLQKAIQKINRTTREMFLAAFQALRAKFSEVFVSFFEGGQADLLLLDEQNPLDSGIEIAAQPPGKKLRSISLLSGGEKALTAISLLFASFLIHPSPFCILDEIDAPLDEENTRRFLRVLRQMTTHSQFLIITHNKRTMEQADILYGVTMPDPGVSKLISVRLEASGNGNGAKSARHAAPAPRG